MLPPKTPYFDDTDPLMREPANKIMGGQNGFAKGIVLCVGLHVISGGFTLGLGS
jgi:hypothetical protein